MNKHMKPSQRSCLRIGSIGLGLMLNACCSSPHVSVEEVKFYDPNLVTTAQNHYVTAIEISVGRTKSLGMESSGYSSNCFAKIEKPDLITVWVGSGELRIEAISPGETRVDVQCDGDNAGEYALCNAPFRNSGSVIVTVK
jgi:hypothetical protein